LPYAQASTIFDGAIDLGGAGNAASKYVGRIGAGGGSYARRTLVQFDFSFLPACAVLSVALKMDLSSSKYGGSVALFNPTPFSITKHHLFHTKSLSSVEKAKIRSLPLNRTKTSHKPVPSAQNPPFLQVGDQKKSGCGKRRDEEGTNNFQVSKNEALFRVGDVSHSFVSMSRDDGRSGERNESR
jgi:hypothetical protein